MLDCCQCLPRPRYPVNKSSLGVEPTYLSYQTLTIDLYAPLLLLVLLFSLLYTLLSCSCSRLSDRYRLATRYNKPAAEMSNLQEDPSTVLARLVLIVIDKVESQLYRFKKKTKKPSLPDSLIA